MKNLERIPITKEQCLKALKSGVAKITADPNGLNDAVCVIGENWFYFDPEDCGEGRTPEEYCADKTEDQLAEYIADTLSDFMKVSDFHNEFDYYAAVLREHGI